MSNELYYRGSNTYEATVTNQLNQLRNSNISLRNSMRNMEYGIRSDIRASTYAIVASQQMLAETFLDGFDSVNNTLEAGFGMLSSRLSNLEISITKIGEKICNKLDAIHDIVNNPLLTQSRELYRRALTNYNKGYYEEALSDCKAAVEKNKTDYISWNLLGQIFLFGAGKFSNVINLDYAEKAFTNAAKYIDADLGKSDEANQLGSEIYYYLGYTKLLLSNDYLVENKIDDSNHKLAEAENHSKQAYQLYNENILAAYEQAKELHFLEKDDESLAILEEIFKKEPLFAVKAGNDKNFESIWNKIDNLIKKLTDEITNKIQEKNASIYKSCEQQIDSLKQEVQKLNLPSKEVFEPLFLLIKLNLEEKHSIIKNKISSTESTIRTSTRFQENLQLEQDSALHRISESKKAEKEELYKEFAPLENFINNPYCPTNELFNEKCDDVLKKLKATLSKFDVSENTDYLSARKMHNEIDSKSVQEWTTPFINPLQDTLKEFKLLIEAFEDVKRQEKDKAKDDSKLVKFLACIGLIIEFIAIRTQAWGWSVAGAVLFMVACLFTMDLSFYENKSLKIFNKLYSFIGIAGAISSLILPFLSFHPAVLIINGIGSTLVCTKKRKTTSIIICILNAVCAVGLFLTGHWVSGIMQLAPAVVAALIMAFTH